MGEKTAGVIITPVVTASYPHLFKPRKNELGEERYSVALVFDPDADLKPLKAEALRVAKERWGAKATEMIREGRLRMPFRTDAVAKGYPEGSTFVNVSSTRPPGIVSVVPDKDGLPSRITDPAEIYPGVRIRASLQAYAYDRLGNAGVSFGLRNIQKVADGERLDGGVDARHEFEADPAAAADLAKLDTLGTEQDDLADLL